MQPETQPYLILIVGPNGAGKTTFRKQFLENNSNFANFTIINWDEEIAKIKTNTPNIDTIQAVLDSGKIVVNQINTCLENKQSFIYESVATSKHSFNLLTKKHSFKKITIFIGLSNVELSMLRVKTRVLNGGHDIPVPALKKRFPKILNNLSIILENSDTCFVIDNSGRYFKPIFVKSDNFEEIFEKIPNYLHIIKKRAILIPNDQYNQKTDSEREVLISGICNRFLNEKNY